jgi:RNA polymerase sigma-70 factor (ECF subfamily)
VTTMRPVEQRVATMEVAATRQALGRDLEQRFVRFVAERREKARRLAWRLVGGHDGAADDVTQEAFLKAYRGLAKFRDDAALDTWFYRILVRQAQHYRRWRALRDLWSPAREDGEIAAATTMQHDPVLRSRIAVALRHLSSAQRQAFVLVHLEEFTVREAAAIMGKAEGTVKSHLHRALRALRKDLADLAREPNR